MKWTDERVALLKKMWEEGVSASHIAVQLGDVSRNAVIGKVHRLKISRPTKSAPEKTLKDNALALDKAEPDQSPKEAQSSKIVDKVERRVSGKTRKKHTASSGDNSDTNKIETAPLKDGKILDEDEVSSESQVDDETIAHQHADSENTPNDDVVVPISRRLSLLQLNENTCKWPVGDPLGPGFYFCGAKTSEGSPYCSYHSKIAFQPIAERRRIKA